MRTTKSIARWSSANKQKRQNILEKSGYVGINGRPLHRKIYADNYGPIPKGYEIHHIDTDKKNNDPKNLIAIPPSIHDVIHRMFPRPTREEIEKMIGKTYFFKPISDYIRAVRKRKKKKVRFHKREHRYPTTPVLSQK